MFCLRFVYLIFLYSKMPGKTGLFIYSQFNLPSSRPIYLAHSQTSTNLTSGPITPPHPLILASWFHDFTIPRFHEFSTVLTSNEKNQYFRYTGKRGREVFKTVCRDGWNGSCSHIQWRFADLQFRSLGLPPKCHILDLWQRSHRFFIRPRFYRPRAPRRLWPHQHERKSIWSTSGKVFKSWSDHSSRIIRTELQPV